MNLHAGGLFTLQQPGGRDGTDITAIPAKQCARTVRLLPFACPQGGLHRSIRRIRWLSRPEEHETQATGRG